MTSGKSWKSGVLSLFQSFFPKPKQLFISAAIWTMISLATWYGFWRDFGIHFGMGPMAEEAKPIGLGFFITPDAQWFYAFFLATMVLFCGFWQFYGRECKWRGWSIWGTAFLLIVTKYTVDVSVCLNNWQRPLYDKIQLALSGAGKVKVWEFYDLFIIFAQIATVAIIIFSIFRFFLSHYLFRWRTAMNEFYMDNWEKLRRVEGASQRVQEDTMNFASMTEGLGANFVEAFMTLLAFLPILIELEKYVKELPLVGVIPHPLLTAAIFWSLFGTVLLWVVGIKLPGLEFNNQKVEAAYRKELVYGEDHGHRADPMTVAELFTQVRGNYFKLYFNYFYFNIARRFYINADNIYAIVILAPGLSAAAFSLGVFSQIQTAFGQVSGSFQYLVNSWDDIIKLISIYKRLRTFEQAINDEPLPEKEVEAMTVDGAESTP